MEVLQQILILQLRLQSLLRLNQHQFHCYTVSPSNTLVNGDSVKINISATDPNGKSLDYTWNATDGVLSSTKGLDITWIPPSEPGEYTISVLVKNDIGGTLLALRMLL